MRSLHEFIATYDAQKRAIAHLNAADLMTIHAVLEAAHTVSPKIKKIPVIIGMSENERDFFGVDEAVAVVKALRKKYQYPLFLNADHTKSVEKCSEAAFAGFDAVIFDGSALSFEENIAKTRDVVTIVKNNNPKTIVEGEVGFIGSGSEIREALPEGAAASEEQFTKPEEAARFVRETGVDLFSPAVGNIHGIISHGSTVVSENPHLDIERITLIRKAAGVPLVLHGGSGTPEEDFLKAIVAGISVVHISTEIRFAWRKWLENSLKNLPNELASYKILAASYSGVKDIAEKRIKLFAR